LASLGFCRLLVAKGRSAAVGGAVPFLAGQPEKPATAHVTSHLWSCPAGEPAGCHAEEMLAALAQENL